MVSFMISNLLSGTANATPVSLEQHATHRLHEHWQNLADLALSSKFHSKNRMTENGEWSWGLDVSNGYACNSHPSSTKACVFHKNDAFCKNGANRRDERRELSRKAKKRGKKHERQHIKHQRAKLEETMRRRHCHSSSFSVLLWAEGAHAV